MSGPSRAITDRPDGALLSRDIATKLLELARAKVQMELAWVSTFHDGQQIFEAVAGDAASFGLAPGHASPLEGSYCARVVDGRRPSIIPNCREDARTGSLEITHDLGIGSYIGVPIPGEHDVPIGTLCCVSRRPTPGLDQTDVRFLEHLAAGIAELQASEGSTLDRQRMLRDRVGKVLRRDRIDMAFQPIMALATGRVVGAEALARFPAEPRQPDVWFADAESVGLGTALQLAAVRSALAHLDELPSDVYLAVNASPALLTNDDFHALLRKVDASRIVVEITEHAEVDDYDVLNEAIARLRRLGARLAVDDAGAGFSSFNHVLRIKPDILKLDISITRGVDHDPTHRALAHALVRFSHDIGATIVAEGVETQAELDTLLDLDIDCAQGYLLARPATLPLPTRLTRPTARLTATSGARIDDALSFVARIWSSPGDLESITRPLLDAVLDRTGLQTSYLTVIDPQTGDLEHRFVRSTGSIEIPEGFALPWDDTLCKRCQDAGIRWTADVPTDIPGCGPAEALGVQTFLSVPIHGPDGTPFGTLCAASTETRYLGAGVVAEVELFARLLGDRSSREDS
ncbi:MAG: EAL domain-containing protein [Acidimicrobiia bacterium]